MNKRKRKKMNRKCLLVIADEMPLLTMTEDERKKADKDYENFRIRYAYRRRYKDLKEGKTLRYFYPQSATTNK